MAPTHLIRNRRACVLVLAVLPLLLRPGTAGAAQPEFGEAEIIAQVPLPGFPEGIAIWGNKAYVAGPATFGTAGTGPSATWAFNVANGNLVRSYVTEGENLAVDHANSGVAVDGVGRVYVLNIQTGIFRILADGSQEQYSTPFPDLPICSEVPPGTDCAPMPFDAPALPNDMVFDQDGNAYITDSLQATVWRVPPGGGDPVIWFQDIRFATTFVGVNGLRISPDGSEMFLTVTVDLAGRALVYRLAFSAEPTAADMVEFHEYATGDIPDGLAFGEDGLLYIAIATPFASGVSILDDDGVEVERLGNGPNPLFPYDSPANIAFDGKGYMLLTNHAFFTGAQDPDQFTILKVFVDDRGAPLEQPLFL